MKHSGAYQEKSHRAAYLVLFRCRTANNFGWPIQAFGWLEWEKQISILFISIKISYSYIKT